MFAIGLLAVCIFLGALGQISMKTGMNHTERIDSISDLMTINTVVSIFSNYYIIFGLMLYFFGAFLWLAAMSTLNISFMYPLLSLAYIITAIFAVVFLGEVVTLSRWAGIMLVIAGCILIMRS